MPLDIPEPANLVKTDKWKGTATLKKNSTGDDVLVTRYTITHADGTTTVRTVTNEGGKVSMEEEKLETPPPASAPSAAAQRPIAAPRDLPADGVWSARRQIFTDEGGTVKITVTYEVTAGGKTWKQTEEQLGIDGPVSVTKVEPEGQPAEEEMPEMVPAANELEAGKVVSDEDLGNPSPSEEPATATRLEIDDTLDPEAREGRGPSDAARDLPAESSSVGEVGNGAPPKEAVEPPPINPPRDVPIGAGWKARRESVAADGVRTLTTVYDIEFQGKQWTQKETVVGDGLPSVEKSEPRESADESRSLPPIQPPSRLPSGGGWKARRESLKDERGVVHLTTNYEITHDGKIYEQKEVQVGDADPVIDYVGPKRDAPPLAGPASKPIGDPVGLPTGAGWKAKRSIVTDEKGIVTTETNYVVQLMTPAGDLAEYDQKEIQIGDGEIQVTKSDPKPVPG